MRKISSLFVVLFLACSFSIFAKGTRADIDALLKEYEDFVVYVEKNGANASLSEIEKRSDRIEDKLDDIDENSNYTIADMQKLTELAQRLTTALTKLNLYDY